MFYIACISDCQKWCFIFALVVLIMIEVVLIIHVLGTVMRDIFSIEKREIIQLDVVHVKLIDILA